MDKNDRSGMVVFTGETTRIKGRIYGIFDCDCGNRKAIFLKSVEYGKQSSCGCTRRNPYGIPTKDYYTIYQTLSKMTHRCYDSNFPHYVDYGGRGIKVCQEWLNDCHLFIEWAILNGWKRGLSIDRIDTNGNYEPSNCKWSTPTEQARNRRSNILIEHSGVTKCVMEWCEELGIPCHLAYQRRTRGKTDFDSVFAPQKWGWSRL